MDLGDILTPGGIYPSLKAASKKEVLQQLAGHAAGLTSLDGRHIFDTLLQRERLSSTGLGRGIAIPHVKLSALKNIVCLFARLEQPVDFESHDGEPVDLVFLLLAPEHASGDHLKALARISRIVREAPVLERLRAASTANEITAILKAPVTSHAA